MTVTGGRPPYTKTMRWQGDGVNCGLRCGCGCGCDCDCACSWVCLGLGLGLRWAGDRYAV